MTLSVIDCLIKIESSDRENQVMTARQMKPRPAAKESNPVNLLSWRDLAEDGCLRSKCGHYYVGVYAYHIQNTNADRISIFGGAAGQAACETHARRLLAKQTMNLACLVLGIQRIADLCDRHRSQVSRWKNGHTLVPIDCCAAIEINANFRDVSGMGKKVTADNLRPDVEFIRQNGVIVDHKFKKEI